MKKKITKDNIAVELSVEQLNRIGFKGDPYKEVAIDGWYSRNQWPNKKMEEDFKKFAIEQIKKTYKLSKKRAELEFSWFNLCWGLKSAEYHN